MSKKNTVELLSDADFQVGIWNPEPDQPVKAVNPSGSPKLRELLEQLAVIYRDSNPESGMSSADIDLDRQRLISVVSSVATIFNKSADDAIPMPSDDLIAQISELAVDEQGALWVDDFNEHRQILLVWRKIHDLLIKKLIDVVLKDDCSSGFINLKEIKNISNIMKFLIKEIRIVGHSIEQKMNLLGC